MITELNKNIRNFYDASSPVWEEVWGEHMHHGHYGIDGSEKKENYRAQLDLIDELIEWGEINEANQILDIGCGIGGSSFYPTRKYKANVTGITLSPVQANRARERAFESGLDKLTHFMATDVLTTEFIKNSFDLVWALESAEHIPMKYQFLKICESILQPGGKLIMVAWCRRPVPPDLSPREDNLLKKLYRSFHLPDMISIEQYSEFASQVRFSDIHISDWTAAVLPFWPAVIRSTIKIKSLKGIIKAGRQTIRGALAMRYMIRGQKSGLIKYGVLKATKK